MYHLSRRIKHTKLQWDFDKQTESPNLGQITKPYNNEQQKKITCWIVDFPVLADHWVKLKESEKKDKYFYLARNWENCGIWKRRLFEF